MYKLSDDEATHIFVNWTQPIAWLALSNKSENEVTDALVKRAYAAVSCRNPLLRAIHKPEIDKFSLVIRGTEEIIQDEIEDKLPAHLTKEFHTREEAWAEYKRRVEDDIWKNSAMWEVLVCILDKETSVGTNCVIISHFNHGVADGAVVMAALGEFVRVLNAGLTSNTLPPHNFLGESTPIPKPFLERYPLYKFDDPSTDEEKEDLFAKVVAKASTKEGRIRSAIVDKILTEEATKSFIAKCKKYGVSVTAGFFAATAMAASAKKFDAGMPLSYRTKDNWGDFAVSFTNSAFLVDLEPTLKSAVGDGGDEDAIWAALAKVFNSEIRKKFSSPEEMYRGVALNYVRYALDAPKTNLSSMCAAPDNECFAINMSNVGIMDGYFKDDGPLKVLDVTGLCSNSVCPDLIFWCYTFRGRFRISILDATYTPRRELFEEFAYKIINFVEKN